MESFPFRPPQFSDDAGWLPAWLQSDQAATPLNQLPEDSPHHHSLQDMDPLHGDKNQVADPNFQSSEESRYEIGTLCLSGGENTPLTLSSSAEKVLCFNLQLSTDGTSSNISPSTIAIPQGDKLISAKSKPVQSAGALHGLQGISQSNVEHNLSAVNLFPSSEEKGSGNVHVNHNQTKCNSTGAGQTILDILNLNSKGTECDDIKDAVELSVAASEALVIHELVNSGSISEALSAAAILEVALQVKQARLDSLTDSLCSSKDDCSFPDILSDLDDSDMEDAYKDVGLSVNNLDSILVNESFVSQVKDTPMSELHCRQQREVRREQQGDQQICFRSSFASKPLEKILDASTSKPEFCGSPKQEMTGGIPAPDSILGSACGSQDKNLDDLQITQGGNCDIVHADQFGHQLGLTSSPVGRTNDEFSSLMQHSHRSDIDKVNEKSTCRLQSHWIDGLSGKEKRGACGMQPKVTKAIHRLFVAETSYLSESADVASDRNSFVHNHKHCSKASESSVPLECSNGATGTDRLIDQDINKDSCMDPLCSIVPCSISTEINDSPHTTGKADSTRVHDINTNNAGLEISEIPLGTVQVTFGNSGENVGRKDLDELVVDAIGPSTIVSRQLTSLRPYSVGLPGDSISSLKRASKCNLAIPGETSYNNPLGKHERCSTIRCNKNDRIKQASVKSTSDCAAVRSNDENIGTRLLLKGKLISCANTSYEKGHRKRYLCGSLSSCSAINVEKNHETSGFGEASCRPVQEDFEPKANGAVLQVQLHESPLVLSRRTHRRFKAPKLPVPDFSTAFQMDEQRPGSDDKCKELPQDLDRKLPDSDIPARKKVRFSEIDIKFHHKKNFRKIQPRNKIRPSSRVRDRHDLIGQELGTASQEVKERLTNCRVKSRRRTIFQGLEFLLTGFPRKKEKEIEVLLRKHGGMILSDIPSPPHPKGRSLTFDAQKLPVILCTKKLQTTKFLYGCAVNAFLLKAAWAYDSIQAGSVLPPDKYVISFNQIASNLNQIGQSVSPNNHSYIFDKVGIMLHGRNSFCSKLVKVIKHGRGHVYRSLHWLVQSLESNKISLGAVVTEDENRASRHLRKCAAEQKIPVVPASWIIRSLFEGKLLPFDDDTHLSHSPATKVPAVCNEQDWSQEI